MKRLIIATACVAIGSVSAFAADLPARVQPPAPVVPVFSWTGFYLGGELGWIRTNPEYTTGVLLLGTPFVVSPTASDKDGLSYGALAGYNYQTGNLVLGVEGDFQGWTVGKIRYTAVTGDFLTAHSKWGGSIRGRLGYAADRALFYLTGGAAFVSNETSIPTTGISIGGDGARLGWTVGAGLDYAITNNWFTGIEYRYSQFEAKSFIYPIPILNLGSRRVQAGTEQQSGFGASRLQVLTTVEMASLCACRSVARCCSRFSVHRPRRFCRSLSRARI